MGFRFPSPRCRLAILLKEGTINAEGPTELGQIMGFRVLGLQKIAKHYIGEGIALGHDAHKNQMPRSVSLQGRLLQERHLQPLDLEECSSQDSDDWYCS